MPRRPTASTHQESAQPLRTPAVRVEGPAGAREFAHSIVIGRGDDCDYRLAGESRVSRQHAELRLKDGRWHAVDLESRNGTLLDGQIVDTALLPESCTIQLGVGGPQLRVHVRGESAAQRSPSKPSDEASRVEVQSAGDGPPSGPLMDDPPRPSPALQPEDDLSLSRVASHYFGDDQGPAGERTQFIRQAYAQVQQQQRRRYSTIIFASLGVGVIALVFAGWQAYRSHQVRASAEAMFQHMRQQEVALASQLAAGAELSPEQLAEMSMRRRQAAEAYAGFVEELGVYRRLSEEERLIYTVARKFNESEFSIPAGFVREVQSYIRDWQRSNRFRNAVEHAEEMGYTPIVVQTMRRYDLPPEFYYLALQESNFNSRAVGPTTRWGIAKGAWQFIPSTGQAYGLRIGPRADVRQFDPQDQRHDFAAAADAAARYLLDIYAQLAQASGLLAFASYNWGEHRVIPRLDDLPPPGIERARAAMAGIPQNPQERSYWRFYTSYADRMPDETKGYVMNIFAAAVIGENPRFFGIEMDNPLARYLEAPQEDLDRIIQDRMQAAPEAEHPAPLHLEELAPAPSGAPTGRLGRDALRQRN